MLAHRHWPISRQIIVMASGLLLLLFALLTVVVTELSMRHSLAGTESNLSSQVQVLRATLDTFFDNVKSRGERSSTFFGRYLQASITLGGGLVATGPLELPELRVNGQLLNSNQKVLLGFKELSGDEAALLVLHNGSVYRAATLLKKDDKYMDGTQIPAADPVAAALLKGEGYSGLTVRNGQYYFSVVKALKTADGKVFGGMSVRIALQAELGQIRAMFGKMVAGKSGYVYIIRPTGNADSVGEFVLHPSLQGKTVVESIKDPVLRASIDKIIATKDGLLRYVFSDKEGKVREKIVAVATSPGWGWIVGTGSWLDEYLEETYQLRNLLIVVGLLAALLSGVMLYFLVNMRLRPLKGVVEAIDRMGTGDLRQLQLAADPGSKNELLHLAASLSQTVDNMRALVNGIEATSQHVSSSAETVEHAVQDMLSSSEHQSQAATGMAATMEEISASIMQVADNARKAADVTSQAHETSRVGSQVMNATVQEMERIASEIQKSAQLVLALGERSQQISSIVGVIRDIADQTNLLALNAAIEAARAGESGRGFAVVADEVRKLAERTTLSTKEISDTISAIAADTHNAAEHMESVREQMGEGMLLARQANETLQVINSQSDESLREVNEIAEAAREQSVANQAVAESVEQIARMAEESAAIASQNHSSAVSLSSVARQMRDSLARFKM
jgi:methyl-accepting chemotaxis protein